MIVVASFICLTSKAELSGAIDAAFNALSHDNQTALGSPLSPQDKVIFGGKMAIRAYQKAFFIAVEQDGKDIVEKITLQFPSPKTPPFGNIMDAYNVQKGRKTYGAGLEGEHIVFGEQYRLHVFEHAVMVWRKQDAAIQAAIFEKSFKPSK